MKHSGSGSSSRPPSPHSLLRRRPQRGRGRFLGRLSRQRTQSCGTNANELDSKDRTAIQKAARTIYLETNKSTRRTRTSRGRRRRIHWVHAARMQLAPPETLFPCVCPSACVCARVYAARQTSPCRNSISDSNYNFMSSCPVLCSPPAPLPPQVVSHAGCPARAAAAGRRCMHRGDTSR